MEWTDIRLTVAKHDADTAEAIATMIAEGGIYIEDYSDLEWQVEQIAHVDLIEQELLDSDTDLRCDVIKLGHHGSASSSTLKFLQATHARTAILSYGADNSYGHPHEETLKNLNAAVIRDVRSTAEEGTIVINFPKNIAEENAA